MSDQTFEVKCGFFDSINKDRLYSASEMNRPYHRVISNGVFATPQGEAGTDLQVLSTSNGMNIIIKKGEGIFANKWFEVSADIPITVPSNTGIVPRIDSVIVQVDKRQSGRKGNIVYRTGNPSSTPTPPDINTVENVIEYRLANITVSASTVAITQDVIADLRGSSECPWVTSLIQQVDTSMLFLQWQAAYERFFSDSTEDFNEYEQNRKAEFDQFLENLTSQLSVATNVIMFTSNYLSQAVVTNIPINIPSYDPDTDVLMVFINGLRATEGVNYTLNANETSIDLAVELLSGQAVNFLVFKSVIAADIQSTVTLIQQLNNRLSEFMDDSSWINLTLQNGATSYDSSMTPSVRNVGDKVYVRGAIKGLTTTGKIIATIPVAYQPAMTHVYNSNIISDDEVVGTVSLKISTAGELILLAKSDTIPNDAMISISTEFILN